MLIAGQATEIVDAGYYLGQAFKDWFGSVQQDAVETGRKRRVLLVDADLRKPGVHQVFDSGTCTGANAHRYYSYRTERGQTGRMLALLALSPA